MLLATHRGREPFQSDFTEYVLFMIMVNTRVFPLFVSLVDILVVTCYTLWP